MGALIDAPITNILRQTQAMKFTCHSDSALSTCTLKLYHTLQVTLVSSAITYVFFGFVMTIAQTQLISRECHRFRYGSNTLFLAFAILLDTNPCSHYTRDRAPESSMDSDRRQERDAARTSTYTRRHQRVSRWRSFGVDQREHRVVI